jgi:hypothetical protein
MTLFRFGEQLFRAIKPFFVREFQSFRNWNSHFINFIIREVAQMISTNRKRGQKASEFHRNVAKQYLKPSEDAG